MEAFDKEESGAPSPDASQTDPSSTLKITMELHAVAELSPTRKKPSHARSKMTQSMDAIPIDKRVRKTSSAASDQEPTTESLGMLSIQETQSYDETNGKVMPIFQSEEANDDRIVVLRVEENEEERETVPALPTNVSETRELVFEEDSVPMPMNSDSSLEEIWIRKEEGWTDRIDWRLQTLTPLDGDQDLVNILDEAMAASTLGGFPILEAKMDDEEYSKYQNSETASNKNYSRRPGNEPSNDQKGSFASPPYPNHLFKASPVNFSPMSSSSWRTPMSIMSAGTSTSYRSARSTFNSPAYVSHSAFKTIEQKSSTPQYGHATSYLPGKSDPRAFIPRGPIAKLDEDYRRYLEEKDIILPPEIEVNWSGKGQHVTFMPKEEVPLKIISHLGASKTANVDKVKCRRIMLARKTMRCNRTFGITDALREVEHLHRLRHFHIVQLVGTYLQARYFSILMYPAADHHLGTFLEDTADMVPEVAALEAALTSTKNTPEEVYETAKQLAEYHARRSFLFASLQCLASTISYIHTHTTKHMDIKPQNILVRRMGSSHSRGLKGGAWRIYLADFGLSRSFEETGQSQTDGPTGRTPRYCAPEVYNSEPRGRAADVFSLGCVFLEMLAVYFEVHPQDFADYRRGDKDNDVESDDSFRNNLEKVSEWIGIRRSQCTSMFDDRSQGMLNIISKMIYKDPADRPTAIAVEHYFWSKKLGGYYDGKWCCGLGPEPFVAAEPEEIEPWKTVGVFNGAHHW